MGRKSTQDMERIIKLINKICQENNTISPTIVGKIAKEQYGEDISNKTLLKYCPTSLISDVNKSDPAYENTEEIIAINKMIADLTKEYDNATSINDKCKLSTQLLAANESKTKIKKTYRETDQIMKNKAPEKINIVFGEPSVIEKKKPFFKTDEKQKALPVKKEGDEK